MRRLSLCLGLLAAASSAFANGAMGLGLEMFSMETWTVYVVVTLIFEAWYIGRWRGLGWPASLGISLLANLLTGFGCISICAVGLHQSFVGSQLNPNPFWNAVALFTGYGLVSATFESILWALFRSRKPQGQVFARSILAHLIGVPLGLAILLIPSHPYVGVVAWTNQARLRYVEQRLKRDLPVFLADHPFPKVDSVSELLKALPPTEHVERDEWAAAYEADLTRFSTGGTTTTPIAELNTALSGARIPPEYSEKDFGHVWLIRKRFPDGNASGLVLDRNTGDVTRTIKPEELGFTLSPRP